MLSVAAAAADGGRRGRLRRPAGGGPGRGRGRPPRRWPAPRSSCRCWPGPAWSTRAGAGLCVLLDALVEVLTGEPRRPAVADAGAAGRPAAGAPGDRIRRVRVRGAVPARRRRRRRSRRCAAALDGLGDSLVVVGTGERRPADLERARPRQRRRRGDRGRRGGRPAAPDRGDPVRRPGRPAPPAADAGRPTPAGAGRASWWRAGDGLADAVRRRGRDRGATGNPSTARDARRDPRPPAPAGWWCCRTTPTPTRWPRPPPGRPRADRRPGQRGADPVAGAGAGRAGGARPGAAVRRRRDRDGRGGRRLPVRRGLHRASREALTVAGRCRPGDVLGLVDGEVHLIGDRPGRGLPPAARPDARRRRRAGHAGRSARTPRPGWPRRCARHVGADAGRSSRCSATPAASRTTAAGRSRMSETGPPPRPTRR